MTMDKMDERRKAFLALQRAVIDIGNVIIGDNCTALEAAAAAVLCPDELWAWCEMCQRSYAPRSSHASDPSLPKRKRGGKERRVRQNDLRMVGDKIHAQRGDALCPINRSGDDRRTHQAPSTSAKQPRFVRGSGCVVVDEERKGKDRRICGWGYSTGMPKSHIDALARADRRNKAWIDRRKPRG